MLLILGSNLPKPIAISPKTKKKTKLKKKTKMCVIPVLSCLVWAANQNFKSQCPMTYILLPQLESWWFFNVVDLTMSSPLKSFLSLLFFYVIVWPNLRNIAIESNWRRSCSDDPQFTVVLLTLSLTMVWTKSSPARYDDRTWPNKEKVPKGLILVANLV